MESERALAAVSVAETGSSATVSRCSTTVASTAACQPLPQDAIEEAAYTHRLLVLKQELLRRHDVAEQYTTKCQELDAMAKCLDDVKQQKDLKDDECRRLEQELKQTKEALEESRKIEKDREAANKRLVEINQRLDDERIKHEATIKQYSDIVTEKDSQIDLIRLEKVNMEQLLRAELETIKRRANREMKKLTVDNGKMEKLAEELKGSRAKIKFLKMELKRNEKELQESKKMVTRVSAQLAACEAKLKHAQERCRASAYEDVGRHEKGVVASHTDVAPCASSGASDTSSNSACDDVVCDVFDSATSDEDEAAPATASTANVSCAATADEDRAAVQEAEKHASAAASCAAPAHAASSLPASVPFSSSAGGDKACDSVKLSDSSNANDARTKLISLTEILQEVRKFPALSPICPASVRKPYSRTIERSGISSPGVSVASRRIMAGSSSSDDDLDHPVAIDDDLDRSIDDFAREIELQMSTVADFVEPGSMVSSRTSESILAPESPLSSRDTPPVLNAVVHRTDLTPSESDGCPVEATALCNDDGALPFSSFTGDSSVAQPEGATITESPQPCHIAEAQLSDTSAGLHKKSDERKAMRRLELAKQERLQKQLRARHAVTACSVDLAVRHCERSRPVAPLSHLGVVDSILSDGSNQSNVGTPDAHLDNRSGASTSNDRRDMLKQDSLGFEPESTSVSLPLTVDDNTQRAAVTDNVRTSMGCESERRFSGDVEKASPVTFPNYSDCTAFDLEKEGQAASLHAGMAPSAQSVAKSANVRCCFPSPTFGGDQRDGDALPMDAADGSHRHNDQTDIKTLPIHADVKKLGTCGDPHANGCATASRPAADAVAAAPTNERTTGTSSPEHELRPVLTQPNNRILVNGDAELDGNTMLASSRTQVGEPVDDGARTCSDFCEPLGGHAVSSDRAINTGAPEGSPLANSAAVPTLNVAEDSHATSDVRVSAALHATAAAPRHVAQRHLVWLHPRTAARYDTSLSGQHVSAAPESTGSAVLKSLTAKEHATVMPAVRDELICGTNVPEFPVVSQPESHLPKTVLPDAAEATVCSPSAISMYTSAIDDAASTIEQRLPDMTEKPAEDKPSGVIAGTLSASSIGGGNLPLAFGSAGSSDNVLCFSTAKIDMFSELERCSTDRVQVAAVDPDQCNSAAVQATPPASVMAEDETGTSNLMQTLAVAQLPAAAETAGDTDVTLGRHQCVPSVSDISISSSPECIRNIAAEVALTAVAPSAGADPADHSSQEIAANLPLSSSESTLLASSISTTLIDLPEAAGSSMATRDNDYLTLQPKPATNSPSAVATAVGTESAENTCKPAVLPCRPAELPSLFAFLSSDDRTAQAPSDAVGFSSAFPERKIGIPASCIATTDLHHYASLHCSSASVVMPTENPAEAEPLSSIVSKQQAKIPSPASPMPSARRSPATIDVEVPSDNVATGSTIELISVRRSASVASPAAAEVVKDQPRLPSLFSSLRSNVRVKQSGAVVAAAGTTELSCTPMAKLAALPEVSAPKADSRSFLMSASHRADLHNLLSTLRSNGKDASQALATADRSSCFANPELVTDLPAGSASAAAPAQMPVVSVGCGAVAQEKELSTSQDGNLNVVLCSQGVSSICPVASYVEPSDIRAGKEEVAADLPSSKSCDLLPVQISAGPAVVAAPTNESDILLASSSKDQPVLGSLVQSFSAAVIHPHTESSTVCADTSKSLRSLSVCNASADDGTASVGSSKRDELQPVRSCSADEHTAAILTVTNNLTMTKGLIDGDDGRIALTPVTSHRPETESTAVQRNDDPELSGTAHTCRRRPTDRDSAESPKAGSFVAAGLAATVPEPAPCHSANTLASSTLCAQPGSRKSSLPSASVDSDDSCCNDDNLVIVVEDVPSDCLLPGDPDRVDSTVAEALHPQVTVPVGGGARLLSRSPPAGVSTASTLFFPGPCSTATVAATNSAAAASSLTPRHSTVSTEQPSMTAACSAATPGNIAAALPSSSSTLQPPVVALAASSANIGSPATSLTAAAASAERSCPSAAAAAVNAAVAGVLMPLPSAAASTPPRPSLAFSSTADALDSDDDIAVHIQSFVALRTRLSPLPASPVRRGSQPASAAVVRPRAGAAAARTSTARAFGFVPLATGAPERAPLSTSSITCNKRALGLAVGLPGAPASSVAPMVTPSRVSPCTRKRIRLDVNDDLCKSAVDSSEPLVSHEARQPRDQKARPACSAGATRGDRSTAGLPCIDPRKFVPGSKRTAVAALSPLADDSSSDVPAVLLNVIERQKSPKARNIITSQSAKPNEPGNNTSEQNGGPLKKKKKKSKKVFNDDRAARRTHAELRGCHQVPRPIDPEAATSGRTVVTYGGDDDPFDSAFVAGADLPHETENRVREAEQTVASAARGRGRPVKSKEPGQLKGVGRGSRVATASADRPPTHGKSRPAQKRAASSTQQEPKDNTKQKGQKNKKKGKKAGEAICEPVALPYENQMRYAEHEVRRYVLGDAHQATVREIVLNLTKVVRQPEALLESVIKMLSQSQEDQVAAIENQCQVGTYSPPMHTKVESRVIVLLHFAKDSMTNLYQHAIDMLATAAVHSSSNDVTVHGRSALCRVFTTLCKSTNAYARARALVCEILTCGQPAFPALVVAIASSWPDLLRCSGEEDVYGKAFERIVMQKLKADSSRHKMFKQMLTILQKLCKWSAVAGDCTALCSRMLCDAVQPVSPEKDTLLLLLRSVAAHEPWSWIKPSLIMDMIWPKLGSCVQSFVGVQRDSGSVFGSEAAADLIVLLGSLCQRCPPHDPDEVKFVGSTMSQLMEILTCNISHKEHRVDVPWSVQTRTFDVLLSLAPYDPNMVARAIRIWMTPNHARIEHRVKDDVQSFWRAYPGASAGESR